MTTGERTPDGRGVPEALEKLMTELDSLDRTERGQMLIELSREFEEVSPEVAARPFPEDHRVLRCESEAYVWALEREDGTLEYQFAVENPQGVSARAMAAILQQTVSGETPEKIAAIPSDIAIRIFGGSLTMGKGEGLMGIVAAVSRAAKNRLERTDAG